MVLTKLNRSHIQIYLQTVEIQYQQNNQKVNKRENDKIVVLLYFLKRV